MRFNAVLAAVLFGLAVCVSCGGDDESCQGDIINNCANCECTLPQHATCTAYPKGDTRSNLRCCVCE